jgi:protein disulfide-isomerase A1
MLRVGAFLLFTLVGLAKSEIEVEDGVLVLTMDNFQDALTAHPLLLVEFYAPWCGHCKKLAPEYASAAKTLEESGASVKLGMVDATQHKGLASNYGVKGYPTLKFFQNGEASDYTGGRTADTIVSWLNKKSGPAAATLDSLAAVEELVGKNQVTVIGFFKDLESESAKGFLAAASQIDEQVFVMTSAQEVFSKFAVTAESAVIILKKFDEGRNTMEGDITAESVQTFVNSNALPMVVDFNSDTAKMIFSQPMKGHFMIFSSAEDEDHEKRIHTARKIAKDYKGKVMFVSVTTDEKEHHKVLEFFGIWDTPTFRIANVMEDFVKYKPESSELTEDNMRAFIEKFLAGELTPDLKSEPLPEDWDATPVKVLVSKNFDEVVMNKEKDVLVEFYAPWCGHCKKLTPIWEELGEKMKDVEDVVIAKMDSTANEILQVKVKGFPTIKLFKKDNTIVDYTGDRTLNSFVKFLRPEMAEVEAEATEEPEKKEAKEEL